MTAMSISIEGIDATIDELDRREKLIDRGVSEAVNAIGDEVYGEMLRRVPVETGRLQRSLMVARNERERTVDIGPEKASPPFDWDDPELYAQSVEFGDVDQQANPFMRPAADAVEQRAPGIVRREMGAAVA